MSNASRYIAHERLHEIGVEGQLKIKQTRVSVVGCGGLGCFVLQSLVALGVGQVTIIDDDKIELQNLQRQILFKENDIGKFKSIVAKRELTKYNSEIDIVSISERLDSKNYNQLLYKTDIIIDCTDNIFSRLIIDDYCSESNLPMVYAGVKEFEGQVSVFNYKGGKSFKTTFPNTKEIYQNENCNDSGVTSQTVAIAGNLQVNEVFKIILDLPNILQGQLQTFSLLNNTFRIFYLI